MSSNGKTASDANSTQKGDGPAAHTPTAGAKNTATKPATAPKLDPKLWEQIIVGSTVIAPEKNTKADGYWPARVTGVKGDLLTIQWLDFPKQPPLTVKRRSVALLLG